MPSLFTELRRRNVFKVGAAYAIVAWLLIEVSSVLLPTFNAPQWIMQVFTLFVILGFPLALILAWAFDVTPQGIEAASDVRVGDAPTQPTGFRFGYISQGLILLAVGFLVVDQYVLERSPTEAETGESTTRSAVAGESRPVRRYEINLGFTEMLGATQQSAHVALSRDGRRLVYAAARVGELPQLYLRELDQREARVIPGTEGAFHPFFSPDGEWVVFFSDETDQKLKKVAVRGGSPQTLADAGFAAGGSWIVDGFILFATRDQAAGRSLYRIGTDGGTPEPILESDDEKGYVTPDVLPGGEAVLVVVRPGSRGGGSASDGSIALLSLATSEIRELIRGGFRPRYVSTGHVLFARDGDLWAAPFDLDRLEITGPEVPVVQNVQQTGFQGGAAYAFSDDGVLMYLLGSEVSSEVGGRSLLWVDRQGNVEPLAVGSGQYINPRLSPDGQKLAVAISDAAGPDIWIYDLDRGSFSRLTFRGDTFNPLWAPDGQSVVFDAGSLTEGLGIYRKAADGTGDAEPIVSTIFEESTAPRSFSPDGAELVVEQCQAQNCDLYLLSLTDGETLRPLLQENYSEHQPAISPDGKWLAYVSLETAREEIYVRPFPNVQDRKWPISLEGGVAPRWGPSGRELFYRSGDAVIVVTIDTESGFSVGNPTTLFSRSLYSGAGNVMGGPIYDISPDGQRFLMMRIEELSDQDSSETKLHVVENWFEELNRLAPPSP